MNDDLVVQKILKLLENNTAFIGYALNGGIGTKINVRNTETGKTIQALSINVDSTGEVLVVKDSEDGQYKVVNFKTAEKVSERIIQLRKTKPIDDKKEIDYTDSDIEVFYLFVKLINTGSPVPSQLTSTWIRKGSSCTQFVGAYERCNYASKATIGGVSYTGLPYIEYPSLQACLNDDNGRDAKTPHGTKDEQGGGFGIRIYSTKMTALAEQNLLAALESHDAHYGTSYKKLFGYGSILECGGGMYVDGWELVQDTNGQYFFQCDFQYFPGYDSSCTTAMQQAGYCTTQGFINSKTPPPGSPGVGGIDNSWAYEYGWVNLPYDFMYKRHFFPLYVNGQAAQGSFLIISGLNDDQIPTIPPGYFPWTPGCPANGQGGPYDGSGGNRFPDGPKEPEKRDMKLSTHKAEIWLASSKKSEAIKLYELGASDLFSGMYNAFIIGANETTEDVKTRIGTINSITQEDQLKHQKFYENRDKNIIDLNIDPRVWVYTLDNIPKVADQFFHNLLNPQNKSLQIFVDNLYNRTINLSLVDKKTQIVHLKLGLIPKNELSNTDCKATIGGESANDNLSGQSWEYQKYITIKIKDWEIESTTNTLNTSLLETWNKNYIERKYLTSFGFFATRIYKDIPSKLLLRSDFSTNLNLVTSGNHYEQYNYTVTKLLKNSLSSKNILYLDSAAISKNITSTDQFRNVGIGTFSWWELWNKTYYDNKQKKLNSIVGYEANQHQLLRSFKLDPNLDYSSLLQNQEAYFEYISTRPKTYISSNIKKIRDKSIPSDTYPSLSSRETLLNSYGNIFYFSLADTLWSNSNLSESNIPLPSSLYIYTGGGGGLMSDKIFNNNANTDLYSPTARLDTRRWINRMWAQFVFDGFIKVDVDSYKNVDFTLPTNPAQYIKYATTHLFTNSEYNFPLQPSQDTTINSVLSPGVLDITKQVKITKPTNIDLDANYSFLVYIYPYVEVTKKKKTI